MVPGKREGLVGRKAVAERDVYIAGRDQFISSAGEPAVPGLLPRDIPEFTGREDELDRLTTLAAGGSVVVTAIGGTAGVGKTALAVHAAHLLLDQFPDGQLYGDLRGYTESQAPAQPGEVLEVFLRRLGVAGEEMPAGVEERSGLLRQLLKSRRVLMVLDNVATEAQVRPLLPGAGGSVVLVTSRSVLAGLEVDARVALDVLAANEADSLLAGLIGPARAAAEPQAVAQVRDWCGCLPLALGIAGQLLAVHPSWPVARLAGMLADERDRLGQLAAGDQQMRVAFAVSYRQLDDGDARMFRLLGLHPGRDFDTRAAARLADTGLQETWLVLDRLVLAHLITEDASGRFGMHDLLRLFARSTCQDTDDQETRDAAEARLVGRYADLAIFLSACLNPDLRQAAEQDVGSLPAPRQALAEFEAERPNLLAAQRLAAGQGWHENVLQLGTHMSEALILLRHLDDLLAVCQAALAAARNLGDTAAEGEALGNLGIAYDELRRFEEAVGCHQDALAIFRETGDRRGEGQTLTNLGNAYVELRRVEEAIGCYQQDLAICREAGDRYGEGQTLGGLGIAYAELRRFEEAVGCHQDALAICLETGDRHGEGQAASNIGDAYRALRRFEEAVGCYQDALAIFRETGDRYGEGQALTSLGIVYENLRRVKEAVGCYQDALAIFRETGDRYSEGQAVSNLGSAYAELRRVKEAVGCYQDALAIFRETGDRHGEGQALTSLGIVYENLRRVKEAVGCYQDALAIFRETGDRHGEGQTLTNLGDAYRALRRFEEAVGCYQDTLAIFRETGDRYSEGQALTKLGVVYSSLRQREQAAICWRDAAAAMRDAGDNEQAARLEQAVNVRSRRRRWKRDG